VSVEVTDAVPDEDSAPDRCARVLVGLYPPAWRARYATEFTALLADTGVGARQVADVVSAAAAAWARPAARLHDRAGRMRATVGIVLCAWTALAAGAVLFAKATSDGTLYLADRAHPVQAWWYDGYTLAACVSVLAIVAGGLPLAATMLRTSRRVPHHRRRVVVLLGVPPVAVLGFMGIADAVARLVTPAARPGAGIGPGWFLVLDRDRTGRGCRRRRRAGGSPDPHAPRRTGADRRRGGRLVRHRADGRGNGCQPRLQAGPAS
jgi:hypothetical protein